MSARVFHLVVGLKNAKETLGIDERIVHIVVDAVQLADGGTDIGEEHHMVHDFSDGHARIVGQHEIGRQDDDKHGAYLLQKTLQTIEEITLLAGVELQVGHGALQISLPAGFDLLAVERLDDGDALDDVEDALTDRLMSTEYAAPSALHALGLNVGDPEIDGHDAECHQSDIDVGSKHQYQGQHGTCEERQDFDEEIVHRVRQAHDAPVYTRLQFASLVALGGEESHAERKHPFDHPQREVAADQDAHALAKVALEERDTRGHDLLAQQDGGDDGQDARGTAPRKAVGARDERVDGIDRAVKHHGIDLCHQRPDEREHQRQRHQPTIGQHERDDVTQKPPKGHLSCLLILCRFHC